MLGMNETMNANQIMDILNQNPLIQFTTYSLIQNPTIINQMSNIINSLVNNPSLINEIRNRMNQDLNMMMMNPNMEFFNMNNMMNNPMMNPMMNLMMNNMGNNININKEKKEESITVFFVKIKNNENKKFPIECQLNETISEIIEKYKKKYNDNDDHLTLIYNAKRLDPSLTVIKAGLRNNSNIDIISY